MTTLFINPESRFHYRQHYLEWTDCVGCELCKTRRKVVLYRGSVPCSVLFVGEAPGESEDMLGVPFIGPAGKLLNKIIDEALLKLGTAHNFPITYGITNIVACWPKEPSETSSGTTRTPSKEEAKRCQPRLDEIVALADPSLIVTLGDVAKRMLPKYERNGVPINTCFLIHPSAILRNESPSNQDIDFKRAVMSLSSAIRNLPNENPVGPVTVAGKSRIRSG